MVGDLTALAFHHDILLHHPAHRLLENPVHSLSGVEVNHAVGLARPVKDPAATPGEVASPTGLDRPGLHSKELFGIVSRGEVRPPRTGDADSFTPKGDFPAQMRQTMENVKAILEESVSSLDKVVKVNVILTRTTDFQAMNEIYRTYFKEGHYPAQTTIEAKLASKEFLLEIECVADV